MKQLLFLFLIDAVMTGTTADALRIKIHDLRISIGDLIYENAPIVNDQLQIQTYKKGRKEIYSYMVICVYCNEY